jgi:plastocyanin
MRGRTRTAAGGRRSLGRFVGSLALAATLAACGSGTTPPATGSTASTVAGLGRVTTTADGVQQVTIQTQDNYVFSPDRFTVAPGKVRLTVVNVATQYTHAFRFTAGKGPEPIAAQIPVLAPGERQTIEFTVTKPGDYRFECSFHIQLGQFGTMTVKG